MADEKRQAPGRLTAEMLTPAPAPTMPACESCRLLPAAYGDVPTICQRCNATYARRLSDLDAFRAMLERAGIENVREVPGAIVLSDNPPEKQDSYCWADTTFEFDESGKLKSVKLEGS